MSLNACWASSVDSVSKVLSITFFIFVIHGVEWVWMHSLWDLANRRVQGRVLRRNQFTGNFTRAFTLVAKWDNTFLLFRDMAWRDEARRDVTWRDMTWYDILRKIPITYIHKCLHFVVYLMNVQVQVLIAILFCIILYITLIMQHFKTCLSTINFNVHPINLHPPWQQTPCGS